MKDYKQILQAAEEAVKTVHDPELKKIAFAELLKHDLGGQKPAEKKEVQGRKRKSKARKKFGKAAKPTAGIATIRPEVQKLDLNTDEKGLPRWSSLKNDWKKFCWILEAARKKGVDGLSSSEISYLIEGTFRENYPTNKVGNLKFKLRDGIVKTIKIENKNGWKILAAGTRTITSKP